MLRRKNNFSKRNQKKHFWMLTSTICERVFFFTTKRICAKSSFKIIEIFSNMLSMIIKFVKMRWTIVKQCLFCMKTSFQIINLILRMRWYKRMLRVMLQVVSFVTFKKILKRKWKICSSDNNKVAIFENVTHSTIAFWNL